MERALALAELALVHRKAPAWDGKWWGTRPSQGKPPAKTIDWEATPEASSRRSSRASADRAPSAVRLAAISAIRVDRRPRRPAPGSASGSWTPIPTRPSVAEVALALGRMGDKEALPLLIAALRDVTKAPEAVRLGGPGGRRGDRRQGGGRS